MKRIDFNYILGLICKAFIIIGCIIVAAAIVAVFVFVFNEAYEHYNDPEFPFSGGRPDCPFDSTYYPEYKNWSNK